MLQSWTDDRLDYLNHRVDEGFRLVDQRLDRIDGRLGRVEHRIERVDDHLMALQRTFVQFGAGIVATISLGFLGILATTL